MYLGRVVESGADDDIYDAPKHPYTQALLSAVPVPDPGLRGSRRRIVLTGEVPSPTSRPAGCRFASRCWRAEQVCTESEPELLPVGAAQEAACHFVETVQPLALEAL